MKKILTFAGLVILLASQSHAAEQKVAENRYTRSYYVDGSFGQTRGLPSIKNHVIWKDGSNDYVRTVAVEGCGAGEGRLYFSSGGRPDAEDSWDMSDDTSNEALAKFVCSLAKQR